MPPETSPIACPLTALIHAITDCGASEMLRHVSPGKLTRQEREAAYRAVYAIIATCLLTMVAQEAVTLRLPSPGVN